MSFKVVCTSMTFGKINRQPYEQLIAAGCEVITNSLGRPYTEKELIEVAGDADALIVGTDKVPRTVVEHLKNIKIIAKHGVGFDTIDLDLTKERGIFVTNVPRSNSQEVADLVFAFILAIARNICQGNTETRAGKWLKHIGVSLHGKTLGIIGTGNIGQAVAKRGTGFDMEILAHDLFPNESVKNLGARYVSLEEVLTQSDFITLHLPNSADTFALINDEAFAKMKPEAILINTARTELVDLKALERALATKRLRGYGTDVFSEEPTPYLPIFDYENVIISPHIGATTTEANLKMGLGAVASVLAVKNNQRPEDEAIRNGL